MLSTERICDTCLSKHLRSYEGYARANPNATVDDWVLFWTKNEAWQMKQMTDHCYKDKSNVAR